MDAELAAIARRHLSLATLDTRRSDALDFSDQAVWSIKAALEAAYEAGRAAAVQPSTKTLAPHRALRALPAPRR